MKRTRSAQFFTVCLLTTCLVLSAFAGVQTVTVRGRIGVPLANIAAYYGMKASTPAKERVRLQNKWNQLEFQTDSRSLWINGTLVLLSEPVLKISGKWSIDPTDFNKTIEPAVRPQEFLKTAGSRIVVLDPGHGGDDNGASSPRSVREKLVVMDVANRVKKRLEVSGIQVELTRENDRNLELPARCRKAAALKADLFVSIHANSAANRSVRGAETFVLSLPGRYSSNSYGDNAPSSSVNTGNRYDLANMALGFRIQENLIKATGQEDRGVKRARFEVLRDAPCPAALVEIAFLSNAKDEAMVIEADGRDRIARGIANGITAYLADVKRAKSK